MAEDHKDAAVEVEAAQLALRESLERARELVCEAKQVMRDPEAPPALPPNPAK